MQQIRRNMKLDEWKWIAAFLVVAIHTSPLESINELADFILTREIGRIAVPLFFMITGFFVLPQKDISKSIKKLSLLYLLVTVLYLPVEIYKLLPMEQSPIQCFTSALKSVFFDGTYYHLWYMPAVIIGLLLVYCLLKLKTRVAFFICILLYLIGLIGDSYYGLISGNTILKTIYDGIFSVSSYTRNGIFFAPIFLILGYFISFYPIKKNGKAFLYFIISMALLIMEGLLLHFASWQKHDSMYLMLPVCMVFLFLSLTSKESVERGNKLIWLKKWQDGPMLLYFIHPYVILLLRGFVKITKWNFFLTISPLYYFFVLFGSLCIVVIVILIKEEMQKRKVKKNELNG